MNLPLQFVMTFLLGMFIGGSILGGFIGWWAASDERVVEFLTSFFEERNPVWQLVLRKMAKLPPHSTE